MFKIKFLLLAFIIFSLTFIYQNTPTFSLDDIKIIATQQVNAAKTLLGLDADSKTTVYSRKNEAGIIEFSDSAPTSNANTKIIVIDGNANLIPAVRASKTSPINEKKPDKETITGISPATPYTEPKKIKQLIEDASNLENVLNNRKSNQDRQLENM